MKIHTSDVICTLAGKEKGKCFFVVGTDGDYVLIADGKSKKMDNPKCKRRKHVRFKAVSNSLVAEKLREGKAVTNSELRQGLKEYTTNLGGEEGGM